MDRSSLFAFIEKYKAHSCLWDISHVDYMNKNKRISALEDLIPLLGETATIDIVRKKIDVLRNCYTRELKKIKASTRTGSSSQDIYTPTLWYFDALSFLSEREVSRSGVDNINEQVNTGESSSSERPTIQRKKRDTKTQDELINVAKKLLTDNSNSNQNRNTFGSYLETQLENVRSDQKFIAEKLMSEILYHARNNNLNESSTIVTNNVQSTYHQEIHSPCNLQSSTSSPIDNNYRPISHGYSSVISSAQTPNNNHRLVSQGSSYTVISPVQTPNNTPIPPLSPGTSTQTPINAHCSSSKQSTYTVINLPRATKASVQNSFSQQHSSLLSPVFHGPLNTNSVYTPSTNIISQNLERTILTDQDTELSEDIHQSEDIQLPESTLADYPNIVFATDSNTSTSLSQSSQSNQNLLNQLLIFRRK